jgi:predicted nucleic acid-binding protein
MRIVIDTSMIFSLLLGKNVRMRDTFFDPAHIFYAPNYTSEGHNLRFFAGPEHQ